MPDSDEVSVWRAPGTMRLLATGGIVALLALVTWVAVTWGYVATIAIVLALAAAFQAYWQVLRPQLSAGPEGIRIISGRQPVSLSWRDIRRCEATARGLTIVTGDGREVVARFPSLTARDHDDDSVAARVATYLTHRASWERRPNGPRPTAPAA